jgi:signal recognition particle GTPase
MLKDVRHSLLEADVNIHVADDLSKTLLKSVNEFQ